MGSLSSDLHHSIRVLAKSPGFTTVAVAALALGIGANTAIFTVINKVLLEPLPYPDSNRIMRIARGFPSGHGNSISIPKFMAWKKNNRTFSALAMYDFSGPGLNLGEGDHPEQVKAIHVTSEYFAVFGVAPALGRAFLPQEDQPGGPKAAVLSHDLWVTHFGSDPSVIGKPVVLGAMPYTVVGVLPPRFSFRSSRRSLPPLSSRPQQHQPGSHLSGRRTPQARRLH